MQKLFLFFIFFTFCQFVHAQDLKGKWVNLSFTGEENSAYEFLDNQIVKMYYGGMEIKTEEPVKYKITDKGEYFVLEMSFKNKLNGRNDNLIGRLEFQSDDVIEMEFWSRSKAPGDLEFTEESVTYVKQEGKE